MKLSVIIVNYNVKYFLEQCLYSAQKACASIDSEVFVVDNNSVDGSCQMVREKFPSATLIENQINKGFSTANNQAIKQAKGEYILLLNPDTIVEEDSFMKCIRFMDEHPDAGGLGVKMIDGKGQFLPESKRGLPTPSVAFYKIFGLAKLFKKSKRFGRYHLGHLNENQTHEIEILSGAFMFLRKRALDKVGLLDEDFFMYGEDIDLSYRITQGGYKNYYFPETTIIHYKGESTKKGSINYVKVFYQAMAIFARKHFSKGRADVFSFLINMAIYFRAFLALASRVVKATILPLLDALVTYAGFLLLLPYWEIIKYEKGHFPPEYLQMVVPVYILIWITCVWVSGGYQKPIKTFKLLKGLAWGSICILVLYSLIGENWRFSRALILMGSAWAFISLLGYRFILSKIRLHGFQFDLSKSKKVVLVANPKEAKRITDIVNSTQLKVNLVGLVSIQSEGHPDNYLGNHDQLREIIRIHKIDEIIFSATDMSSQQIIGCMLDLSSTNTAYKIAPPESISIIGSSSIDTAGELYVVHLNAISKEKNQRNKRLTDLVLSITFLISYPITCWTVEQKGKFFRNIIQVIVSHKSWVGYTSSGSESMLLPNIKPGILTPADMLNEKLSEKKIMEMDMVYAKDYRILHDLEIIFQNWEKLGK